MKFSLSTIIFIFCLLNLTQNSEAQSYYWIGFTNKANTSYSLSKPYEFLSEKSIGRRIRQNIAIDSTDLPVNRFYITSVTKSGARLVQTSKWLNGITVQLPNDSLIAKISALAFVREIQLTKPGTLKSTKFTNNKFETSWPSLPIDSAYYGASVYQIGQLNGQYLHNQGFKGAGMVIAVLDAGFYRVNTLPAFNRLWEQNRVLGTRDYVNPSSDFFTEHSHGMMVLSTMGGFISNRLVGTSPDASFWLLRTEDSLTEYLIEEDNWVAAAEFADSVGVDIINSSLGYYEFDAPAMNHTYADMNGKTTRVTRGANLAAKKGIMVFASAGNEARNAWQRIIAPSDGEKVIAVAAVTKSGIRATFSSIGPAAGGAVKPDLAAMGSSTVLQGTDGLVVTANGTSFSSPVLAGMVACLWQSNPNSSATDVKNALFMSAHLYQNPDSLLGYGIPNMQLADLYLKNSDTAQLNNNSMWQVFPNPFNSDLVLFTNSKFQNELTVELISMAGTLVSKRKFAANNIIQLNNLQSLKAGLYILRIYSGKDIKTFKVIKTNKD